MLSPENRPVAAGDLASQEPFTAWLHRGIDRDRIFAEPKLYPSRDPAATSFPLLNAANLFLILEQQHGWHMNPTQHPCSTSLSVRLREFGSATGLQMLVA
jgi:hypothetical protein